MLEFQHVVQHYLQDMMEAGRGGQTGAPFEAGPRR
jgi:hypothetical protein